MPGKTLSFRVNGVAANAEVELFADGQLIGKATAGSVGSVVILTDGTLDLADGSHTITARQTLRNQPVNLGNVHTTVDLASETSTSMTIVVDTVTPQITSTPPTAATEATAYAYDVETDEEPAGGMSYRLTTAPAGMTIDATSGLIRWTPADGQGGTRQVTVQATDKAGNVVEQNFTISVTAVNQIPLAFAQTATTPQNRNVTIVLAGDDGDAAHNQTLRFALVDAPSHGTIYSFNEQTGELIYSPNAGFSGDDTFTFTVTDSDSDEGPGKTSTPATVTVHVTKVNNPPLADDQTVTLAEDGSILITLTGDDGDPEATQTLTFTIVQWPQLGVLADFDATTGKVTYRPHPNYSGTDSFTFTVTDDATEGEAAKTSAPATVGLSITAVNDAPRVTQGPVRIALNDPATWSFKLSADDGDPEVTQQLTFAITVQPRNGQIAVDALTGDVTYTPNVGFRGTDRFVVTVTDDDTAGGAALTSVATTVPITVFVKNMAPVGAAQDLTVAEDGTLLLTLSGDDGDPDVSQVLSFAIASGPSHGQIRLDPSTGQAVYVPAPDFNGQDGFEFTVSDYDENAEPTSATSQPVRVTITVTPVDDAPRFEPVALPTAIAGVRWTVTVQARDPDGLATIEYGLEPGAPDGMQIDPATGQLSWTPPETLTDQAVTVTVRATEVLGGQAGSSAVQMLEIKVQDLRGLVLHSTAEELIRQRQSDEAARSQPPDTRLVVDPTWLAEAVPADRAVGGSATGGAGGLGSAQSGLDALSAGDYGIRGTYGTDTGWGSNALTTPSEEPAERKPAKREPAQPAEKQTSKQPRRDEDTSEPRATQTDDRASPVVAWDAVTPPAAADAAIESLVEADPVEEAIAALAESGAAAWVESGEE